jgi:N-acetylglutamate synthase-like GNAT family acetyltransferase
LPERVKRLSLPSCRYNKHDLKTIELMVTEGDNQNIIGVAAWEPANPKDASVAHNTLLLHGIYVQPALYHHDIGQQLLCAAEQAAIEQGCDALQVKAQSSASGFFLAQGMQPLDIENEQHDYAHRYCKPLNQRGEK